MAEEKTHKYHPDVEAKLATIIVQGEFRTGQANKRWENMDYESYVDLLDGQRREKNYAWMSDVHIPEFASHQLAESANDVEQSFQTRDFVEMYIEDGNPQSMAAARASQELINRTLNQRYLHYFPKHIRAKLINRLGGHVDFIAGWERDIRREQVGTRDEEEVLDVDQYGVKFTDPTTQIAATRIKQVPVYENVIYKDRFNFEVLDPRHVITNNTYEYSLQDKDSVIVQWPKGKTINDLKAAAKSEGYFNLDILEANVPTERGRLAASDETDNKDDDEQRTPLPKNVPIDGFKRFGKFWCKVTARDENRKPTMVEPGFNQEGEVLEGAELHEVIMVFALPEQREVLIAFHLTPFIDASEQPYKPVGRGLCYIHPVKDGGFGDALLTKELSVAIDDTFNVSQDRMMQGTYPSFKIKKSLSEDNPNGYSIRPGGAIEVDNQDDFTELVISSEISASLTQMGVLSDKMRQADAVDRGTTGDVPALASTTATASSNASANSSTRRNYKSFSFDHTFLSELYWMIQQMTYRFAQPETGLKLMGEKVYDFDPTLEYTYKPVSQSTETETSKWQKFKNLDLMLAKAIQTQHPDAVKLVNKIMSDMYRLLGDEYSEYADSLLDPNKPMEGGAGSQAGPTGGGPSNQAGVAQSSGEMAARESANV